MYRLIAIKDCTFAVAFVANWDMADSTAALPAIAVCAFGSIGVVDLKSEIEGESDIVKRLAAYSQAADCAVFCGAQLDLFGVQKDGVIVCNKGMLVDIADQSNAVKVYAAKEGNVGLLIGEDCISQRHWQKLAPACDVVLCLTPNGGQLVRERVRMFSMANETPYLLVDANGMDWTEGA